MLFSSDVETYNIVVSIMASYDGSDTEKKTFVVNLSAFDFTHSQRGLKWNWSSSADRIGNQREHNEFSEPWVSISDLKLQMLQKYSSGLKD